MVHIHDIFLPDEYPKRWVIDEGRNWNEQYVVPRASRSTAARKPVVAPPLVTIR